ncbi:MAG: hypothetical protein IKR57_05540 [Bacilli bacterium]|nr:hypothetical protein [Bacilli bacterium]
MKKEKFGFKILKLFINALYILFIFIIVDSLLKLVGFDEWLDLDFSVFISKFLLFMFIWLIIYVFVYIVSILIHELGHLLFGLRANLEFVSFNVLNFTITKENKKLVIKKVPNINGVSGYCNMAFDDKVKYNSKEVISYFFGGIFFNMIMVIIFACILPLTKDYLYLICLLVISVNVYLAFYNMIPIVHKNGLRSDMKQVLLYVNASEFTKIYGKISKIQSYINDGKKLKDIDASLVYMPNVIDNSTNLQMAFIYIDYLMECNRFDDVIKKVKYVREKAKDIMSFSDENLLKMQLILALYNKNKLNDIAFEWDNDFNKYIRATEGSSPIGIAVEYMYYRLIRNENDKCERCLYKIDKLKKYYGKTREYKEVKEFINEVDDRYEGRK